MPATPTASKLTVLFDRVLVQLEDSEGERRSRAGILIPATAQLSKRLTWAVVVSIGPHVRAVKPGDRVLFNNEDRFEVELDGEEYLLLRERDLHGVERNDDEVGSGMYL